VRAGQGQGDRGGAQQLDGAQVLILCLGRVGGEQRLQRARIPSAHDEPAASAAEALDRFAEFSGKWEKRYPAIIRLWENAWAEFVPFLSFDREIRTVICTTNAIESIYARLRRAVNARGHFPTEQAGPQVPLPGDHEPGPDREGP
jgi:hypothetical protein